MKLAEAYGPDKLGLSFELFPPKTQAGEETLWRNLDELMAFEPSFVTCTFGAGGSTREKTLEIVAQTRRRYGVSVALRGDPPKGETAFQAVEGGLRYASELVTLIRREFDQFGIAVAGYPETHQEAISPEADLENLKRKVSAGGDVVITQLFYDNADFFRFRASCTALSIAAPIVPGILPVTNFAQVKRITSLCKACLPQKFVAELEAAGDDEAAQFEVGVAYAARQVQELLDAGVPGIHFYVLNKSSATARVLQAVRR
jgi:methylenetetrahydrofolate reductase (NADPH)